MLLPEDYLDFCHRLDQLNMYGINRPRPHSLGLFDPDLFGIAMHPPLPSLQSIRTCHTINLIGEHKYLTLKVKS